VWRFKRDSQYKHPTQKPVDLVGTAIKNSGIIGGIVLDLFLGSGSTLIACEKNKRICYGMELDPKYVDVVIARYCEQTKTDPEVIYAGATSADTGDTGSVQETQAPAQ
jgi:site-specific DNA-methyltransferase (adenine-specific)